jgi:RNA-binding protein
MPLSEKQKKHLRRLAHALSPVVRLGQSGLTDAVVGEMDRALDHHELIKVSLRIGDREARDLAIAALAGRTLSECVQRIGHVGVFFRKNKALPKIVLPD